MNHHDDSYKFYEFYAFFLRGSFLHFFWEFLFSCLPVISSSRKHIPLP